MRGSHPSLPEAKPNISQSIGSTNQANVIRTGDEFAAIRECSTLDDLLDLSDKYLLAPRLHRPSERSSVQAALQARYLELKGSQRYRPLRDLVGPALQIREVERRVINGTEHVRVVAEHPSLGRVTVLFREGTMRGLGLLVPGAQVRFSAYPTEHGLGFRATDVAQQLRSYRS